jgi:hypothetical protein
MLKLRRFVPALVAWVDPDDDYWDWDPGGVPLDEYPDEETTELDGMDVDAPTAVEEQMEHSQAR